MIESHDKVPTIPPTIPPTGAPAPKVAAPPTSPPVSENEPTTTYSAKSAAPQVAPLTVNVCLKVTIHHNQQIEQDRSLSPSLRVAIELLLLVVSLLCNRLGLNSKNSCKPPSSDPNRDKKKRTTDKKPGGQAGRIGTTLTKFDQPDLIEAIALIISLKPTPSSLSCP